ncbi:MAG: tRNA (guanosine(37)-N1)-methyltransferase TrmD [Desulfovibrionaceae bacterium]|nr:tRNA (guanosine(37)-N1)-methyltransferase TrmD [Desulfovibrionaceae bacterium]
MRVNILSIFPEFFDSPLRAGLMARAVEKGLLGFSLIDPRDFAQDRHRSVDDRPYGGGPGMVMTPGPLARALRSVPEPGRMLALTPRGRPLDQALARELSAQEALTLVCGRYEGLDERLFELFPLEPVSVGDFVLNGGEAAALCLVEAVARLLPEFMGHGDSGLEESFSEGLLEYPQYTRPEEFEGLRVPEVLTAGDHAGIAAWRRRRSLEATLRQRPELLSGARLDAADLGALKALRPAGLGRNLYLALVHGPVLNKFGEIVTVSLTNLDLHDISRVSRSYRLGGMYALTPLEDQRALAESLIGHWLEGAGGRANPDRAKALAQVRVMDCLDSAVNDLERVSGQRPRLVATSARPVESAVHAAPAEVRQWLESSPVLLVLGTGHGLAPEIVDRADAVLRPLRWMDAYNHLSVRSAASVIVDRLLGDVY